MKKCAHCGTTDEAEDIALCEVDGYEMYLCETCYDEATEEPYVCTFGYHDDRWSDV